MIPPSAEPSFGGAVPGAEGLGEARRIAVIDVGSNSVRMVVYSALSRSPAYFFNEKVLAGLGSELAATGRLASAGRRRALAALGRFARLCTLMRVDDVVAVATAAVREAEDGDDFVAEVAARTGLALLVASGEDEARLAAQGVLLGWPDAEGLVADLGGASLELAPVGGGAVKPGVTLPLGPLRLGGLAGGAGAVDEAVDAALRRAADVIGPPGGRLHLVGGAWRALAKLHMARTDYPIQVLHEFEMPAAAMRGLADGVAREAPEAIGRTISASRERLEVIPLAARVLARLIEAAQPVSVAVSAFGLREGVLWERLPKAMRTEDPLLSAAAEMERRLARFPGFGDELAAWLAPLFPDAPARRLRLIAAACRLNDVAWTAHPDYRDQAVFETVYRANLSGVGHGERAWLGAALRHRYKAGRTKREDVPALALLSDAERAEARMLGRAIRLGTMLSGSAPGVLPHCALRAGRRELALLLAPDFEALAGEAVAKRLGALAESAGLAPRLGTLEPAA